MNDTLLTTARWELLNNRCKMSGSSEEVLLELLNKELGFGPPNIGIVDIPSIPIAPLPDVSSDVKIALLVGHARRNDSGAVAFNGVSEEAYNNEIVSLVHKKLTLKSEIINLYEGNGYGAAMEWLAIKLKKEGFTHAFEFHFNSAGPSAKGYEYLHWHLSKKGAVMANVFQSLHRKWFGDKYDRGVEPLGDQAHERGVLVVSRTHCPTIILEPFFGSNPKDAESYMTKQGKEKYSDFCTEAITCSVAALAA